MAAEAKKWMSVGKAAERLGVHEDTVRRYADDGRLESRRLPGRHRRITVESVERMYREIYDTEPPDHDAAR